MFNHINHKKFVGQSVLLSIGEPWDFYSSDGENILLGKIIGGFSPLDKAGILLVTTTIFLKYENSISQIICAGRYEKGWNLLKDLDANRRAVCQMYFNKRGVNISEYEIPNLKIGIDDWGSFLIGSIILT